MNWFFWNFIVSCVEFLSVYADLGWHICLVPLRTKTCSHHTSHSVIMKHFEKRNCGNPWASIHLFYSVLTGSQVLLSSFLEFLVTGLAQCLKATNCFGSSPRNGWDKIFRCPYGRGRRNYRKARKQWVRKRREKHCVRIIACLFFHSPSQELGRRYLSSTYRHQSEYYKMGVVAAPVQPGGQVYVHMPMRLTKKPGKAAENVNRAVYGERDVFRLFAAW